MLYIILKRWLYQYYWYFTYLSGKIIRNIEKSEYDVTVTSSLGVASQNWVWGLFVRRWSLCVNFMTLTLLVPEIQRGVRGGGGAPPPPPPPVTDWPKKPSLNRVNWLTALRFNIGIVGESHRNKRNIQPLINLLVRFFSSKINLRKGLMKSGGLLYSKNNGLTKLSNWPHGVVTSLLVLAWT